MEMCIGKTGHDHAPMHILLFGIRILRQEIIRFADRHDSLAVNHNRRSRWLRGVLGVDVGVIQEFHVYL
jgi:hypothetical protein